MIAYTFRRTTASLAGKTRRQTMTSRANNLGRDAGLRFAKKLVSAQRTAFIEIAAAGHALSIATQRKISVMSNDIYVVARFAAVILKSIPCHCGAAGEGVSRRRHHRGRVPGWVWLRTRHDSTLIPREVAWAGTLSNALRNVVNFVVSTDRALAANNVLVAHLHPGGEEIASRIAKANRVNNRHGRAVQFEQSTPSFSASSRGSRRWRNTEPDRPGGRAIRQRPHRLSKGPWVSPIGKDTA